MEHDLALSSARTVNALAICAGVGGLELGLQLAHRYRGQAVRGVVYIEREAAAVASLVASMEAGWLHPAPIWSDARTFDGRSFRGCVDIVTSGDPCQGNSVAGKRRGELDDRWLLDRAIDIFDQSGAPTFFRENVPGNADGQLAVAIPALERLGCRVAVGIFSSAETGNTMRRERLFILAKRPHVGHERGGAARRRRDGSTDGRIGVDGASLGRHRDADEALWPRRHGAVDASDGLGGPESIGPRESGTEHAGQQGRYPAASASNAVARASRQRSERLRERRAGPGRGQLPTGGHGGALPPAVIPGPADNRGWIDVLDRYPELQPALSQEEAESHLRRGIDAVANRVERLRATGNGVDPVAAATAFLRLDALLAAGASANGDVLT